MKFSEFLTEAKTHKFKFMSGIRTFGEFLSAHPKISNTLKNLAIDEDWESATFSRLKELRISDEFLTSVTPNNMARMKMGALRYCVAVHACNFNANTEPSPLELKTDDILPTVIKFQISKDDCRYLSIDTKGKLIMSEVLMIEGWHWSQSQTFASIESSQNYDNLSAYSTIYDNEASKRMGAKYPDLIQGWVTFE